MGVYPSQCDSLYEKARSSLLANVVNLPSGLYLTAGRNQFKTLWTRDFALSVRGLIAIGQTDLVRNHLTVLLKNRRAADGLVPRVIDSMPVGWRVVRQFLSRMVPEKIRWFDPDPPLRDPLRPEFRDEHGTEAIDSNLLVLLASLQYVAETGDIAWWDLHEGAFRELYRLYDRKKDGPLIRQPPFADWQDSVRREGHTFYVNVLYWVVSERLAVQRGWAIPKSFREALRAEILRVFWDNRAGLFRSLSDGPQISVDGNLLAIDLDFFPAETSSATELYANLKNHELWKGPANFPGRVTIPAYPARWKSFAVRFVNLQNYHEDLHWSWLMGLAGKVAYLMKDDEEGARILGTLETLATRDGAIGEIFFSRPGLPLWSSRWFRAEIPFSWGAAFTIDFVQTARKATLAKSSS